MHNAAKNGVQIIMVVVNQLLFDNTQSNSVIGAFDSQAFVTHSTLSIPSGYYFIKIAAKTRIRMFVNHKKV